MQVIDSSDTIWAIKNSLAQTFFMTVLMILYLQQVVITLGFYFFRIASSRRSATINNLRLKAYLLLINLSNYVYSPAIFLILVILLAAKEKLEISQPMQACILNLLLIQVCSSIWFILDLRKGFNTTFECIE